MNDVLEKSSESTAAKMDMSSALNEVASRLLDILQRENALVQARDIEAIVPLQTEKQRLLGAYEKAILHLTADENINQPISLTDDCKHLLRQLQGVLEENKVVVKAARDARRFVVKAIRDAAAEAQTQTATYGPSVNRRTQSAAIAYNQQV